jgi:serine/threonine protein phosphatase 1
MLEQRVVAETSESGPPIVVFLGDYIDRGPHSARVLDFLLSRPRGFERRFLMGNHEQAMLAFLAAPIGNRGWLRHGGQETLASYGVAPPPAIGAEEEQLVACAEELKQRLPDLHVKFLAGLERYVQLGDYVFVHAGVDAGRPLEQQTDLDLFWSRQRFLADRRPFPQRIVHGHTPVDEPYSDHRRIGVDTGAYASGVLTAARFEGEAVSFVSVMDRAAKARIETIKRRRGPR